MSAWRRVFSMIAGAVLVVALVLAVQGSTESWWTTAGMVCLLIVIALGAPQTRPSSRWVLNELM
jgi:hypothetical protein